MKAKEAEEVANKVIAVIGKHCVRVRIAGSLRRKEKEVGDVDIVVVVGEGQEKELEEAIKRHFTVIRNGGKIKMLVCHGRQVDIYIAESEDFEAVLMHRTGSIGHNIGIAQRAGKLGLHLNITKGLMKDGEVIANTEKGIFAALDLPYKEPWERK